MVIVGGGIAGLISAFQLAKAGIQVTLIEKKSYPLHRVCGEYISNETTPFLKKNGLFPEQFSPPQINEFFLSSVSGESVKLSLDQGGFGISRHTFDEFLYKKALEAGVDFKLNTEVTELSLSGDTFVVKTNSALFEADAVLGCYGKRSRLDNTLERKFIQDRSPYVGVKYHIRIDHPSQQIALHNFPQGYCGISNVEDGKTNLCYLSHRDNLRQHKDVKQMEREVLFVNPHLKQIFETAEFLFDRPEVINEISFATKGPIENHILMAGDAAGMITPLCGNGMAMAIHSAKLASELLLEFCAQKISRAELESRYSKAWTSHFKYRLWKGRQIQSLFGSRSLSQLAVNLAIYSRPLANVLVRNTHGKPF